MLLHVTVSMDAFQRGASCVLRAAQYGRTELLHHLMNKYKCDPHATVSCALYGNRVLVSNL